MIGKKKQRRKRPLYFCLLAFGGLLFWGAIRTSPFNLINRSKPINQTNPVQPANQIGRTEIESTGSSKASYGDGIGVAEATIQSLFEHSDIGFTFENSSSVEGEPRSIGTSAHGLATIELIGQPENLTQATIRVNIPDDDTQALTLNAEYVLRFIQSVAPQWAGGGDWVIQNLDAFAAGQKTVVTTMQSSQEISMSLNGEQEVLTITVKAEQ